MDSATSSRLETFRATVSTTAEDIVFKTFPQKILDLSDFLESATSETSDFNLVNTAAATDPKVYPEPHAEVDGKKRKREDHDEGNSTSDAKLPSLVHANVHLTKVYDRVKKEAEELSQLVDRVKLWIHLTMPKIEDGDNFGVQIQEEVLNELIRTEESALAIRDTCRTYHFARAKICSKLIKYPNVEDYTLALQQFDERQHFMARQNMYDLRYAYAILTDLIHKNITKIRAPKGNNAAALY